MNKKMRITVISLLSVVFAVSVGFLVKDYCDSKMQAELYDNLIETVEVQTIRGYDVIFRR